MSKNIAHTFEQSAAAAQRLGAFIAKRRKALKVPATQTALAAGISRLTLHRLEQGSTSITLGACLNTMAALGLLGAVPPQENSHSPMLPSRVRVNQYPELQKLAWQHHDDAEISLQAAFKLYQNNWRHVQVAALGEAEIQFITLLEQAFEEALLHVQP
ncbi:MAG TPA: XRE family transcriptional regulator [Limnobacter sp.]|uniref:XRE family transcriptional regulator n=1 Tax=Limnobacter sp. TaxID=2003368 RepID=UPI002ED9A616